MFRRFRLKIRVYGNRRHERSFKATINCFIQKDGQLVVLQNCYLGFSKFWKFREKKSKIFNNFFAFSKFSLSKSNFQKTVLCVRGQWLMNTCTKFQADIFKNGWDMTKKHLKTGTFHVISGLHRDFLNFIFWSILTLQKVFLGHFWRSLRKSDLKTCIAALNHEIVLLDLFYLVTWDDLDLYYGHKAQ